MERDLFISHASVDADAAELLVDALERRGLRCWISTRDISVGEDYAQSIIDGIRSSRALVTLLSTPAIVSRNVTREVERAHALDLALLTIRLEDVTPTGSLEYFLASRQFIDAFPSVKNRADEVAATVQKVLGAAPGKESSEAEVLEPIAPLTTSQSLASRAGVSQRTLLLGGYGLVAALVLIAVIAISRPSSETSATENTTTTAPTDGASTTPQTSAPPESSTQAPPTTQSGAVDNGGTAFEPGTEPGRFDGWVVGASADPLRSRNWNSPGPTSAPSVAWRIDDPINGAPVVADGVLYASFQDQTVRALDLATGSELWLHETGFGASTPTVTEDGVYFSDKFDLIGVDRATGANELLRMAPPADIKKPSSPEPATIVDGVAYVVYSSLQDGLWTARLVVTNLDTGAILWQWETASDRALLPVMVTDDVVAVVAKHEVAVFDRETGVERWSTTLSGDISSNIALIADNALLVRDSRLRALELADGAQRWSTPDSSLQYAAADGLIITQSLDVHAINSTSGAVAWATRWTNGRLMSDAISIGDGVAYTHGSSSGAVGAYDIATGVELWAIDHEGGLQPGIPMAVADGFLIAVETDRQLVAFR